ncbi:MAG: hypothetical protein CMG21_03855 [Candidatus Marinimicrobia bacterium]|nr:hypothetical protein [Candidatus Neomarinimicrobiota bacterium]
MAQTSINAIIGIKLKSVVPNKKQLLTSIIIGMMLPDLDFIIEYLINQFTFINYELHNSLFHNIFIIPFIALLILIHSEYKNKNKNVATGIAIGITIHIILDVITMQSVGLLFPLFDVSQNFDFKQFLNINFNTNIKKILDCFEFLFFRFYGWLLIEQIILKPENNAYLIKKIKLWIKLELYIFLLFILFIYFEVKDSHFTNIYGVAYIPSFLFALYVTYKMRKTLN